MGRKSWFLVGTLVILMSTAAVTRRNKRCRIGCSYSPNGNTLRHYKCTYQICDVLKTENLDPNRTMINLISLSLAKNRIQDVQCDVFQHLKKLEFLDLSDNLIRALDEQVFSNLTSLQLLDLSFNHLAELPDRLFSSQDRLETLLLHRNKLRTISISLLTPLSSITSLDLSRNRLDCDCELRLAMNWCKNRTLNTEATCRNRESDRISQWAELEFDDNCLKTPVPSVLSTSVTQYTKSDDMVVAEISSYVVPLLIAGAVALQFMCFGLFVLYMRRQRQSSVSATREERSVHSDSNSSHNYQYDYIQIPNIYLNQPPACPIQTIRGLGHVQVDTCHNEHLKELTPCGTHTACDSCEEGHHMTEPESKKSYSNNQEPVRSGVTSRVSYDLPKHDNASKMAVSKCNTLNRSSDVSVMVENCLYCAGDTLT